MIESLEQVLADARGELPVLERRNGSWSPKDIREFVERVALAAEEWLTWLSEGDAAIRSGYSEVWLRGRFEQLRRDGHARLSGRARQYRACAIPRRANIASAAARGRDAARSLRQVG
jgi:hypothetical protein